MIQKLKFDYDYENDSLFLYDLKSKSKGSVELDDFIIDFNSKKEIAGIEILNASKFFKSLDVEELHISKDLLQSLKDCKVDIVTKSNFFVIKILLFFEENRKLATATMIPTIHEPSPALAKA